MTDNRRQNAKEIRDSASRMAHDREHMKHQSNGDEQRFAGANFAMSFTKGLEHNKSNGLICNAEDFRVFRSAIDDGYVDAFTTSVPSAPDKKRQWEAPTAGLVYELQGPDSHAVTMPPAPALGSTELAYEMAEVYELALLRDQPLSDFTATGTNTDIANSLTRLNNIGYDLSGKDGRPRKNVGGNITAQTAFRGSSPGVENGPYLSQFMLLGNKSVAGEGDVSKGIIRYGALNADQRVPVAKANTDFMTEWNDWLNVQNGADPQSGNEAAIFGPSNTVSRRFISTPRDLATYVHYDALYEAYLNACLILLGMQTPADPGIAPTDPGFNNLSGRGSFYLNSLNSESQYLTRKWETHDREAGGFALWGGPHILTLVTEVATRALKAVRYQKFNIHCRLRPEALAGRIEKAGQIAADFPAVGGLFTQLESSIQNTVNAVQMRNTSNTKLLPMAFQEGSPMHPSYGAGHATVAGACVTILKAYFDTSAVLVRRDGNIVFARYDKDKGDEPVAFVPNATGDALEEVNNSPYLTLEGELNKLAANISIARNMAGVHYFSDYYDSLRMGEKIAI
ncbi:vanadium-dependent haloperoxidase, partial [Nitrosomonas sp.]|uniref:vanadium-dependent haloperoxidase n=1 Tax=Nitrosomonas sp. TaxID=42353 RepID=UPI001D905070